MRIHWLITMGLSCALAGATRAAEDYPAGSVSLGLLGDTDQGRSYSLSAALDASPRWSFNAGGSHTTLDGAGAAITGDSVSLGLAWQPGHWRIEPGFSHWRDNDQFSSQTPELRVSWRREALRLQVSVERPRYAIDYQLGAGPLAQQRHFEFSGSGLGAGVEYLGLRWNAALHGTSYRYGNELTRLRNILAAPNLTRFPRLALLTQSFATLAEGAASNRWSASLERSFTRVSWHGDVIVQSDALTGAQARSLGIGGNFVLGAHTSLDASIGNQHAEGVGDSAFVNLTLSFNW